MTKEEMQFADPEWQPPGQLNSTLEQEQLNPQPVNIPRKQHQGSFESSNGKTVEKEEEADYITGYKARQQQQFASPPQQRHRRHTWRWLGISLLLIIFTILAGRPLIADSGYFVEGFVLDNLIVLLGILAFIIAGIAFFRSRSRFSFKTDRTVETRDFLVGNHPTIIVHNGCGSIRVLSNTERNQMRIQATKQIRGWGHTNNDVLIHYMQRAEDNTIVIDSMNKWSIFGRSNADYEISVPLMTDLELKTDLGKIDVSNVIGRMKLYSDAGSIYATQVSLQGNSTLKTDVGSIYFSGTIENQGTFKFLTDAGSINVNLPEDASFEVDAKTDVGSIRCNFPIKGHSKKSHTKLQGKVGNPPYATLTLKTDIGSITLKQT